jgi:hypothetical protein
MFFVNLIVPKKKQSNIVYETDPISAEFQQCSP